MSLRTIGDLISAADAAQDLQARGRGFLLNWRKHANGVNGVTIPNEEFVVVPEAVAKGSPDDPHLAFALVWIERTSWQVAEYFDADDDDFDESWGANNIRGYSIQTSQSTRDMHINVPAGFLLVDEAEQVKRLKALKANADKAEKERQRLAEIARLQKELADLQKEPQ